MRCDAMRCDAMRCDAMRCESRTLSCVKSLTVSKCVSLGSSLINVIDDEERMVIDETTARHEYDWAVGYWYRHGLLSGRKRDQSKAPFFLSVFVWTFVLLVCSGLGGADLLLRNETRSVPTYLLLYFPLKNPKGTNLYS